MAEQESVKLGNLVAEWRRASGLSQASLADALGTQQATISKLESGAYRLTVLQLLAILNACGLSLSDVSEAIQETLVLEGRPLWERIDE